jgi:putative FmdB family regulatory protein
MIYMPLYEYICQKCNRKYTWLVGVVADATPPTCDRCGAQQSVRKEVSRFARLRSDDEALDSLADPENLGDLDNPAAMRKWAKNMGKELGEDLGDDFEEFLESDGEEDGEVSSDGLDD